MIYICCVSFASLDVGSNYLNDCAWNLGCSSFLISMRMFIVSNALLISSATVIVCAGRAIWLKPFDTVLFTGCSAVTVEFYTRVMWVWLVCLLLCKEEGSTRVSLQLLIAGICACMMCPCLCFVGFWDGDYLSQIPYVLYYVGVKSSYEHAREEWESKRAYVF